MDPTHQNPPKNQTEQKFQNSEFKNPYQRPLKQKYPIWKQKKLGNTISNFIPIPKIYYKNKLDNDLNNFPRLIKPKEHVKDSVNKDTNDNYTKEAECQLNKKRKLSHSTWSNIS